MTTQFFLIEGTETLTMSGFSAEEYILLNSVSDGVTVNSQGIFSYVNTTFAEMVGYGVSELIGMNVLKVTAPEYVDLINERTRKRQQVLEVVSNSPIVAFSCARSVFCFFEKSLASKF